MKPRLFNKKTTLLLAIVVLAIGLLVMFVVTGRGSPPHQHQTEAQDAYPLNSWLPWQTPDYKISSHYNQVTKQYDYLITLYAIVNEPSQHDSYVAQLKQYKQEALDYIKTKGGDPSKLHIDYLPPAAANL